MAVREVLKMGNPTLRVKCDPVDPAEIKTPEFQELIQDMFDTMDAEEGIGIAAPQNWCHQTSRHCRSATR